MNLMGAALSPGRSRHWAVAWKRWGSYARSYRLQKIIESINVEDRPQVLLTGHDHKYVSIFTGGVYGLGVWMSPVPEQLDEGQEA